MIGDQPQTGSRILAAKRPKNRLILLRFLSLFAANLRFFSLCSVCGVATRGLFAAKNASSFRRAG
jgi:hypothetical protein